MSAQMYREYIIKMLSEIKNERYLKGIYNFVHTFFISEDK